MTNDRTYFRRLSDHELIDVTRYGDNELAIVLAERLDKISAEREYWRRVAIEAQFQLAAQSVPE